MMTLKNTVVCDFETNNEGNYVWLWDICNLSDLSHFHGCGVDSFIESILYSEYEYVFFHNLGFDSEFIVSWLLNNGYTQSNLYSRVPQSYTYDLLMSTRGKLYSLRIYCSYYDENDNICKKVINIYDSINKIPMSVEEIADSCKFEIGKLKIDYYKERNNGYEFSEDEIEYVEHDTEIIARSLIPFINNKMLKLTIGSDAIYSFKKSISKDELEFYFPNLDELCEEFCRKSYKGGIVLYNKEKRGIEISEGIVLDCNSMYPYHLTNNIIPFGIPVKYEGFYEYDEDYPLFIQRVIVTCSIKKGHLNCISPKSLLCGQCDYPDEIEDCVLYLTSPDYKLLVENYDIENIQYIDGYKFHGMSVDKNIFKEYVYKWSSKKQEDKGVNRLIDKLMLNSLIGKFASKQIHGKKSARLVEGIVKYDTEEKDFMKSFSYVPLPSFVNAYARLDLVTKANKNFDRFLYCDTDCLHLEGYDLPNDISIDDTKLGFWKIEAYYEKGKYLANKCYCYGVESGDGLEFKFTVSGLSKNAKLNLSYDYFYSGNAIEGNLRKKRVIGGCILEKENFILP